MKKQTITTKEQTIDDLMEISNKVKKNLIEAVDEITPWFFQTLPSFYYTITAKEEQINHLHTVISLRQTNTPSATLHSVDKKEVTFISVADRDHQIVESLQSLAETNIRAATMHSALDGDLIVSSFFTEMPGLDLDNKNVQKKMQQIKTGLGDLSETDLKKAEDFISGMNREYMARYEVPMICRHITFYLQINDYETIFDLDNERDERFSRFSICTNDPPKTEYLLKITKILITHGLKINRLYANLIDGQRGHERILITIYVADKNGNRLEENSLLWKRITSAIKTVKWVIEDELSELIGVGEQSLSVRKANFLRAAAVFVHQFLSKVQVERYTYEVVKKAFTRYPHIANLIVTYFYVRCHPNVDHVEKHLKANELGGEKADEIKSSLSSSLTSHLSEAIQKAEQFSSEDIYSATMHFIDHMLKERRREIQKEVKKELEQAILKINKFVEKEIFMMAIHFVDNILKTNYFIEDSIGLAFRMDPKVLSTKFYDPLPYGFFFFCGRGYKGFHVRFKEMSRGGFRLVRSRDKEHYDLESARIFDEVFGLSKAQQLKNKDIPEGGSKAIALLLPDTNPRECVECVIDSLLDVIVMNGVKKLNPNIVDYYGKKEIIYLGPDENLTDDFIKWIVQRAKDKKYEYPNAFMSSKPGVGINHKEYGVTSQGVNVYVESCLHQLKINPRQDIFTVRMVGGPDGDVAGNEIKILLGSYPHARIVAISDGWGAAYDAGGLNRDELLRLVREGKSIVEFNPSLLSLGSENFVVDASNDEGRIIRDELQVSNRVKSDLFIPAGGRPNTIHIGNYEQSLDEEGKPVFRAIVEGANLFLTNEARLKLEEHGVIIIKDSSANKGGVICSSYEIIASLILSEEEFLEIKQQYAMEVIEILKKKGVLESKLLFREYYLRNGKMPLTHLSSEISKEINFLTDAIRDCISAKDLDVKSPKKDLYEGLIKSHCPPILVSKYGQRILEDIPVVHRLAILATQIASYIVYREGLGWRNHFPSMDLQEVINVYLEKDRLVLDYTKRILASDLPGKEIIAKVLDHNARKELTRDALL